MDTLHTPSPKAHLLQLTLRQDGITQVLQLHREVLSFWFSSHKTAGDLLQVFERYQGPIKEAALRRLALNKSSKGKACARIQLADFRPFFIADALVADAELAEVSAMLEPQQHQAPEQPRTQGSTRPSGLLSWLFNWSPKKKPNSLPEGQHAAFKIA